jgi:hypothetical protein
LKKNVTMGTGAIVGTSTLGREVTTEMQLVTTWTLDTVGKSFHNVNQCKCWCTLLQQKTRSLTVHTVATT